jgi:ubiquinone/menaquinone biosynthesis C-methylase UbiE
MGLYTRHILPTLIDLVMRSDDVAELRRDVVGAARGDVLEIGIGSGLNLGLYGEAVRSVVGVDPSPALLAKAGRRARAGRIAVELVEGTAERLPFTAERFDSVVTTWTLCSIPAAPEALAEVRRVLKPGGLLHFIEHGLAPEPGVQRWQRRLTPLWKPLAGGCHLDRAIDTLIEGAGFRIARLDAFYGRGFRISGFMYRGAAEPRPA